MIEKILRIFTGFIWLGFAIWDANVYYFKIVIPYSGPIFWWSVLPIAICVYIAFGILLIVGKIGWLKPVKDNTVK